MILTTMLKSSSPFFGSILNVTALYYSENLKLQGRGKLKDARDHREIVEDLIRSPRVQKLKVVKGGGLGLQRMPR